MMQCMEDAVLHCHPRDVYASMVCHDSLDAPCDLKQLCVVKQKVHRQKTADPAKTSPNLADNVMTVLGMLQSDPFVWKAIIGKDSHPTVVMYMDEQNTSLRQSCCPDGAGGSVMGIVQTFNLDPCYVTVIVFTSPSVIRKDTRMPPTIIGRMYLHWKATYDTYMDIFGHLRATIETAVIVNTELRLNTDVVISSHKERGLTKAM